MLLFVWLISLSAAVQAGKITHAMSMKAYKIISEASELAEQGKSQEAIELLQEMLQKRGSAYEKAQAWYMIGSLYYKLEQDDKTLQAFTKVMESAGKIPLFLELNTLRTLVQLNLVKEQADKARDYCLMMIEKSEAPTEADYYLLAQTYYRLEDWDKALTAVQQALGQLVPPQPPSENLLILQNAIYFESSDHLNMIATLETLVKHYPKATYLLYMAGIYGQMEESEKQTVIMESLYENDYLLRGSELTNLASMYMSVQVPYKAAKLIEKSIQEEKIDASIRHYEMLSQAWQLAAEIPNAVRALDQAAQLSQEGDLDLRKAHMQYNLLQWQEAIASAKNALKKGFDNDDQQGEAWLLRCMALFNLSRYDDAIKSCQRASDFKEQSSMAKQWISYVASERDKLLSMQAP